MYERIWAQQSCTATTGTFVPIRRHHLYISSNKQRLPVNTSFILLPLFKYTSPSFSFPPTQHPSLTKPKEQSKCTDHPPAHHRAGLPSNNSKMRSSTTPLHITTGKNRCLIQRHCRRRRRCRGLLLRRGMPRVMMPVVLLSIKVGCFTDMA